MEPTTQVRYAVELIGGGVTRASTPVRLSGKELELLILLASARGTLSRDRIGEALWPHLAEGNRANSLKATLCRLRRKLGRHDVVLIENGTYRLSCAVDVDLWRAEAAVRACRAERLDDEPRAALAAIVEAYAAGGPARYEGFDWFAPTLSRVHDVVCRAANVLAANALVRGAYEDCVAHARAALAVDPFDDDANGALIRAYLALGELAAGRRQFRRYAAVLAHELHAAPPPRLAELVR